MTSQKKYKSPLEGDALAIKRDLIDSGWGTPNTYGREFDEEGDFSAVYLFLLTDTYDYKNGIVAYVGMSRRLAQRWGSHHVLPQLKESPFWPQCWFLRTPIQELRWTERTYIKKYQPPWNIIGRTRGVVWQ